jgi:uncharacterized protein YjbJ (UPF0337 family)
MNRAEIKGKTETVKGKIRQATGDLSENAFGRGKRKLAEAVENVRKSIKR